MTAYFSRAWRGDFLSLIKVALAMALLLFMTACTTVNVYAPTFNAPVTSQTWSGNNAETKPRPDPMAAAALSNATSEISLFGLDEDKLASVPSCPVFTRPTFAPVPQIPLQQLSSMGDQDMSSKVDLITRYTRELREWIAARREAFSKAYDLYLLDCNPVEKQPPGVKKASSLRKP